MPWQATVTITETLQFKHTALTLRGAMEALPAMTLRALDAAPDGTEPETIQITLKRVRGKA